MNAVHLNWLYEFGLTLLIVLPFAYGQALDEVKRRTVGVTVRFARSGKAEVTVYFWCSVTRKPVFTARATILAAFGRKSAELSTRSGAKRAGARQITLPMIRMPFADEPGFRTAGTIQIVRSERRRRDRVRVDILDGEGRAIRSRTRVIVWRDRSAT